LLNTNISFRESSCHFLLFIRYLTATTPGAGSKCDNRSEDFIVCENHHQILVKSQDYQSCAIPFKIQTMDKTLLKLVYLVTFSSFFSPAIADLFVGNFIAEVDGKSYRLTIEPPVSKRYNGILMINDKAMQVDAHRFGDQFAGRFVGKSNSFGFRAEMQGAAPLVHTETGLVIKFRRDKP